MKKMTLLIFALFSMATASVSVKLEKGWQFIGFPADISHMSPFDNAHVEVMWGFDGRTQQWLGYSPKADIMEKITAKYGRLERLDARQGVWIFNTDAWVLTLDEEGENETDLVLYVGWNLVSLPVDTAVSPSVFGEDIIWKYSEAGWQLSAPTEQADTIAPPLGKIGSAEAFWVHTKKGHTVSLSEETGELHTFKSREAMETYIEKMVLNASVPVYGRYVRGVDGVPVMENTPETAALGDTAKADDATGTNLQEEGVDESDILKHNDRYVFFYDRKANSVLVRDFSDIASGQMQTVATLPLPEERGLQGMYLSGETLILITYEQRYYIQQDTVTRMVMPISPGNEQFEVRMYDIRNVENINILSETVLDGNYIDSRIVGEELYVISRFSPWLKVDYPKIPVPDSLCGGQKPVPMVVEEGRFISECDGVFTENGQSYRYDYTHPVIRERHLIPTLDNGREDMIVPERFYAPYKLDQYPDMAVISKFSIAQRKFKESVATVNGVNHLYVSGKNLYLTSANYPYYLDFRSFLERETIYKFGIGNDFGYRAKGTVEGGMLSQFSMSEKENMLRVATTSGDGWRMETENRIFVLTERNGKLVEEGRLEGLGEEGERIRGVRFLDDKAYVVTFRQTDPFYVIDLSIPASPRKVGELKINGFSSYLHPVNEHYLLTLGRDADETGRTGGFMLQLYNISDPSSPKLADVYRYRLAQYGFDAEYNPRAFVYWKRDDRFAITYKEEEMSAMDVFRVDTANGKIVPVDRLTLRSAWYENRGMLFDMQQRTYGALFSAEAAVSKELRSSK